MQGGKEIWRMCKVLLLLWLAEDTKQCSFLMKIPELFKCYCHLPASSRNCSKLYFYFYKDIECELLLLFQGYAHLIDTLLRHT